MLDLKERYKRLGSDLLIKIGKSEDVLDALDADVVVCGREVRLLSGESSVLELIGDYVGFVRGREARIVRQLTELLPDFLFGY